MWWQCCADAAHAGKQQQKAARLAFAASVRHD
jgi:hypothetical protein